MSEIELPIIGDIRLENGKTDTPYVVLGTFTDSAGRTRINAVSLKYNSFNDEVRARYHIGSHALNRMSNNLEDDKTVAHIALVGPDIDSAIDNYKQAITIASERFVETRYENSDSNIITEELQKIFSGFEMVFDDIANIAAEKIGWKREECENCGQDHMTINNNSNETPTTC